MKNKMKILKYITLFSIVLGVSSCGDPKLPYEPFDDMEYGAYARVLTNTGEFNFFDVPGSSYAWTVEFYDEKKGQNVTAYSWTVEFQDNTNGGANNIAAVPFRTYTGPFPANGDGYPGLSDTFTFGDALTALGLTIGDINGGDLIRFNATVSKLDGSTFSQANTGPNIISSAPFSGFFTLSAPIVCPSALGGTYNYSTIPWCDGTVTETGTTTWTDRGSGVYDVDDFAFGAYFPCYGAGATLPGGSLQIQDACGRIAPIGASRWGELYIYNSVTVANGGTDLILDWENDYGEAGVSTLSRTDGTTWPALSNGS
jgi:hypothetical protein